MSNLFCHRSREEWKASFFRLSLIFIGSVILAFGTATFLTQLNIVAGGLSGIGIIIQSYYPNEQVIDIIVFILTWILWFLGLIFIGRDFALKTFFSSLIYPFALSLFLRVNVFVSLAETITGSGEVGRILVCALFGGTLVGSGVAITFLGGGSTGGVDVFCFIFKKYLHIRESITAFTIDAVIVTLGMTLIEDNLINGLCGIVAATMGALMIEVIYNRRQNLSQVEVISSYGEEISFFLHQKLHLSYVISSSFYDEEKNEEKFSLRFLLSPRQLKRFKLFIVEIDEEAVIVISHVKINYSRDFLSHNPTKSTKKDNKKSKNNQDLEEKDEK